MERNSKSRKILFWAQQQITLQNEQKRRSFSESEVWWAAIGENIGIEINGKSGIFTRPVLILHKYSDEGFFGIPLTSQNHGGKWYLQFTFQDETSYAVLSQGRTMSVFRLIDRIGAIPEPVLEKIRAAFIGVIG